MSELSAYYAVLQHYAFKEALPEFMDTNRGFDADYHNTKAAIYGNNDQDVKDHLDVFRNFAGSLAVLGENSRSYKVKPPIYSSVCQTKKFIYKQDALNLLMQKLPLKTEKSNKTEIEILEDICTIYLKYKEAQLKNFCELVLYDERDFEKIETMYNAMQAEKVEKKGKNKGMSISNANMLTISKDIGNQLRTLCKDIDIQAAESRLGELKTSRKPYELVQLHKHITALINVMETFINDHQKYFLLNKDCKPQIKCMYQVRVFIDGDRKFCLRREVHAVMNRYKVYRNKPFAQEIFGYHPLQTIDYRYLEENWKEYVKGTKVISFDKILKIETPILRAKHRAVLIPSFKDNHCVMALDALLETLRWLITGTGIFKRITKKKFTPVMDMVFETFFGADRKMEHINTRSPYFTEAANIPKIRDEINQKLEEQFGEFMRSYDDEETQASHLGDEELTLKILQDEIGTKNEYTNLVKIFPDILVEDYSERMFELIKKNRKDTTEGKELMKTGALYEGLEHCQLLALFHKLPIERHLWLEYQGGNMKPPFFGIIWTAHKGNPDIGELI